MSQLAAMDFDINKKDTQQGDDMVDQNLDKPAITWMTRPKAARLEELRERIRRVKKEVFRTEDVANKKRKRLKPMTLTKRAKEIACVIHDLEYPDWQVAEEYLLRYMRKRGVLGENCIHDLRTELNSEYHGATEEDLSRWRYPLALVDQRQQAEAKRFITELSVHNWLQHSNSSLGKAPTSAQVMTKYLDVSKAPMAVNAKKLGWKPVVAMTPKTRKFLQRWRRRWAVKYRKLPLGPTITEAESQNEALVTIKYFCCSAGNQMGKKKRTETNQKKSL
jgi:hypothetical protein